jgi:hypothetical protein
MMELVEWALLKQPHPITMKATLQRFLVLFYSIMYVYRCSVNVHALLVRVHYYREGHL